MPRQKRRGIKSAEVDDRLKELQDENKKKIKNRELDIAFEKMVRDKLRMEQLKNELELKQQSKGRESILNHILFEKAFEHVLIQLENITF